MPAEAFIRLAVIEIHGYQSPFFSAVARCLMPYAFSRFDVTFLILRLIFTVSSLAFYDSA